VIHSLTPGFGRRGKGVSDQKWIKKTLLEK